jgi:Rhodanese-like domain
MFHRRALLVAAGALLALACTHSPTLKELTVDQVAARIALNDGQTALYDCNGKDRFDKGHVPGARWVQYDAVTAADLPAEKGTMLVFYCASEL